MNPFSKDISGHYAPEKRTILNLCEKVTGISLAELARILGTSIPRVSRIVSEMVDDGLLVDLGKQDSSGGRKPSLYGLNPRAGYFVGIDVDEDDFNLAVMDFQGKVVCFREGVPFSLTNSEQSVLAFCAAVDACLDKARVDRDIVRSYGVNLTGRVNFSTGYSYSYFISEEKPVRAILEEGFGKPVSVENDSCGMAFGEYMTCMPGDTGTLLFLNVGRGLGMGMVMDGKLFTGKSGFSGEVGHFPLLDNNVLCRCGKRGCLETGASGLALQRLFTARLRGGQTSLLSPAFDRDGTVSIEDILGAVAAEDITAIECIEEVGATLGRAVAGLINIFNPDMVTIGGRLCSAEHYLMPPLKSAVNKYSLNLVSSDTVIRVSRLGSRAGAIGAGLLAKSRMLEQ